jgi:hypothetical protein
MPSFGGVELRSMRRRSKLPPPLYVWSLVVAALIVIALSLWLYDLPQWGLR